MATTAPLQFHWTNQGFAYVSCRNSSPSPDALTVGLSPTPDAMPEPDIQLIAFYLPQFHPFPEKTWLQGCRRVTDIVQSVDELT